jgi:CRISPR system Cascade subunit CasD
MSDKPNTLLLRVEGPLQAWGDNSKFVVRRTMEAPTKSGIFGLICCAEGRSRQAAGERLKTLNAKLKMGVRIDRPGDRWWDYHTVGGGGGPLRARSQSPEVPYQIGLLRADGKGIKETATTHLIEPLVTRREYLCDASFLVALQALQGESGLIADVKAALENPKWALYLGRKCCPPSRPLLEKPPTGEFSNLREALKSIPWRPRFQGDTPPPSLHCLLDCVPANGESEAPHDALVWYDVPLSFDPPVHEARFVIPWEVRLGPDVEARPNQPVQERTPAAERIRTDYGESTWGKVRDRRREQDHRLCVFCKAPAVPGHHISYRHASKEDNIAALADEKIMQEHLKGVRSLCRYCHDAVTMIEYGLGMGLDRINPEERRWRDLIIRKRDEIIRFRSLETRRRRLAAEEVE